MATPGPQKVLEFQEDPKKERWIQIGKHRHRIANDHDDYLDEVVRLFRYGSKEEALMATSFYGAILMAIFGFVPLRNVLFRALKKGGAL